jgi:low affinity Fe/Cu permease
MMEEARAQTSQRRARHLGKIAIMLAVIVGAQIIALEVVLRGWQGWDALTVFVGIGASAFLCALAVTLFLYTKQKKLQ